MSKQPCADSTTRNGTSAARPSLRARKKLATRRALTHAAIELFGEIGYEAATVSLIAERADVSERTFFEYFPSKEDVVLVASADDLAQFAKHVSEQPMDRPVLE